MISQAQADQAFAICDQMQEIVARLQRDFEEMQAAKTAYENWLLAADAGEGEV